MIVASAKKMLLNLDIIEEPLWVNNDPTKLKQLCNIIYGEEIDG